MNTTVLLERSGHAEIVIGDFYGDPKAAIIDLNERWCLQVGAGLILYWLRDPFLRYAYHCPSEQWWETHRSPRRVGPLLLLGLVVLAFITCVLVAAALAGAALAQWRRRWHAG
jgi:hypothetical protein